MHKFKPGDRVRCIKAGGSNIIERSVELGLIYTVSSIKDGMLRIEGKPNSMCYFYYRFEPCKITNEERMAKRKEELNAV